VNHFVVAIEHRSLWEFGKHQFVDRSDLY